MCNLNILVTKKPSFKKYGLLMERLTTISYEGNRDADGVYFSGTDNLVKSTYKLDYLSFAKDFNQSRFILSHQRLTTSGHDESNHQPFAVDDFTIMHNGVLFGLGTDAESDTVEFCRDFRNKFADYHSEDGKDRETAVVKAIQSIFRHQTGTYSIAIYDKVDEVMYYFKNSSTNINLYHTDDYLFLSTKKTDFWQDPMAKEGSVTPLKIYKCVVTENIISFKPVGSITVDYASRDWGDYYSYGYPSTGKNLQFRGESKKTKQPRDNRRYENCEECAVAAMCKPRPRYDGKVLCKDCYDFLRKADYYSRHEEDGSDKVFSMTEAEWWGNQEYK